MSGVEVIESVLSMSDVCVCLGSVVVHVVLCTVNDAGGASSLRHFNGAMLPRIAGTTFLFRALRMYP